MEGEKKFRCDVDGKSFASQEELDRHTRTEHSMGGMGSKDTGSKREKTY